MNRNSSVKARIAISLLPKLNSCIYLPLIERCGGLEGFFLESDQTLNQLYRELNIPTDTFNRKTAIQNSEAEIEQLDKHEIQICTIEDGCYPELLRQCADAPLVFFYKGKLKSSPANKYLAIVGTRHASSRCEARVTALVEDLVNLGCRQRIGLWHRRLGPPGFPEVRLDDFSRIGTWITHDLSGDP